MAKYQAGGGIQWIIIQGIIHDQIVIKYKASTVLSNLLAFSKTRSFSQRTNYFYMEAGRWPIMNQRN